MKKELAKRGENLRAEYDLAQLKGGVRGKYYNRATRGTNLVLIEPDLSKVFPDSEAVNRCIACVGRSRPRGNYPQAPTHMSQPPFSPLANIL
jgi:hypothetical protein